MTRRSFVFAPVLLHGRNRYPHAEFEARVAKRDFRDMTLDVLPTPAMVVDAAIFERNLQTMAEAAKAQSLNLRPHVKVHKSVDVAKRQLALGALGVTTATVAESELMSRAGIRGVLWTKQPASPNNVARAIELARRDPTFLFVVDDARVADQVEEAAAAARVRARLLVAVHAGMQRQGIANGQPAIDLSRRIFASKNLELNGFMAYSGGAAHTKGWEARRQKSAADLAGLQQTLDLATRSGLPATVVSGGSTGTYNIDRENALTELECGSYVFMDTGYFAVGGKTNAAEYTDFGGSLTVLTTVDSRHHPGIATIDYGNKAMARPTDRVMGHPWLQVANQGAEYGALRWEREEREIRVGDRFRIYCTNLDMSTNCFDRYYVVRGEQVIDVWPIMGRTGAAQR